MDVQKTDVPKPYVENPIDVWLWGKLKVVLFWVAVGIGVVALVDFFDTFKTDTTRHLSKECASRWQGSGRATKWEFGTGCFVGVNGVWVPEQNVQN